MAKLHEQPAGPEGSYPSPPLNARDAEGPSHARSVPASELDDSVAGWTDQAVDDVRDSSNQTLVGPGSAQGAVESVDHRSVGISESGAVLHGARKPSVEGSVGGSVASHVTSVISFSKTEVVTNECASLETGPGVLPLSSPVSPTMAPPPPEAPHHVPAQALTVSSPRLAANAPSETLRDASTQPVTQSSESTMPRYVIKVEYVEQTKDRDGNVKNTVRSEAPSREAPSREAAGKEIPILELITVKGDLDEEQSTSLKIHSPMIINVLRSIVGESSEYDLDGSTVQLRSPYQLLYTYADELTAYREKHPKTHSVEYRDECNRHLAFLLEFLTRQEDIARGFRIEKGRWRKSSPSATFKYLWLLLKPGELVFEEKNGLLDPYIIAKVDGGVKDRMAHPYEISLWNMDCDGTHLGRSAHTTTLDVFDGEVEVNKLRVFPARFHPQAEQKRQAFIDRGRKWFSIVKDVSYQEYTGSTLQAEKRKYERARVVIDYAGIPWEQYTSNFDKPQLGRIPPDATGGALCWCEACEAAYEKEAKNQRPQYDGWDWMLYKEQQELTELQYLLCPRQVCSWVLKERQWMVLDVSHVTDPEFDRQIMKSLVMDESKKNMIQAICHKFTTVNDSQAGHRTDIIPGKGEGQIFLLHGSPGVGKTLTAECVAEYTRRPLMTVTSGDIGIDAKSVESNLDKYFGWAEDWRAILLLDEADIYLERRSRLDLQRNSVVSVFLRALEYYQGILFITTNRVGSFDEAFKSRIHISIFYKPFDVKMREKIWEQNFRKWVEASNNTVKVSDEVRYYVRTQKTLLDLEWNGREIRNGFQTAVALAEYDALKANTTVELETDHLDQVVRMSLAFGQYLNQTRQASDSRLAFGHGDRKDDFNEELVGAIVARTLSTVANEKMSALSAHGARET